MSGGARGTAALVLRRAPISLAESPLPPGPARADLFPETNEALTSEWAFNPLKWVDQLITPALPKTSKTIRAKNEKSARDHGRVSQEQKVAQAVEAATALAEFRDCCGEKADPTFDPKEMEARKKFEFLPGQTDIITELVMSMSLALSSASLMLFGALAEVIAFTLATIQNPENFADLLSAVMSLHAWYQASDQRAVAGTGCRCAPHWCGS